jgi:hypothetical protein
VVDWYIDFDGVRRTSQNCGLYGPIFHPRVMCDVDHGMMILTEANSQLVYRIALAATSTVRQYCQQSHLWQSQCCPAVLASYTSQERVGEREKEMRIESIRPRGTSRVLLSAVKSYDMGPPALLSIRRKVCCGFLSPLKIHRLGRALTRNLWVQWQAH